LYHTWISASDRQFLQTNVWQVCPLSTECRHSIGICRGTSSRPSPGSYKPPLASSVQESYVQDLWCWCRSVLTALLPATSPNSAFLLLLLQIVSISGLPGRATTGSQSQNHDRPAELRCRGTISVEQSSGCSTETRDDSAHFQETTEGLSVPRLMCWRREGTFTTARRCCGVFVILALNIKLQTYLLTYYTKGSKYMHTYVDACMLGLRIVVHRFRRTSRTMQEIYGVSLKSTPTKKNFLRYFHSW